MSARILAVEDTPSLRALLQLCLTKGGYKTDLAEEGGTAVEMFRAGDYDAVIMDIQMPVMDGLTAVALMRAWEKENGRAATPIFALTANTEPGDLRRCLDAGFTRTIRKPFGREELLTAVSELLGAKSAAAGDGRIFVKADPEFAGLIPPFLENCRRETLAMKAALERKDFRAIVDASHKLTGAGASYGFQPLSDTGALLEAAAKASDGEKIAARLEEMSRYLERVSVVYP